MTVKLSILKTHMTNGQWVHAGEVATVPAPHAGELVRSGLAEPAFEAEKAAQPLANKMAAEPKNKGK